MDSDWTKSRRSSGSGQCVQVKRVGDGDAVTYLVRDSKDPNGPTLGFNRGEWLAFLGGAKDGDFDEM